LCGDGIGNPAEVKHIETGGPMRSVEHGKSLRIPVAETYLEGELHLPAEARGIVVFAHGSGSSRHSPRNQFVGVFVRNCGNTTFLFDLLTLDEEAEDEQTAQLRFDIPFLGRRLACATLWLMRQPEAQHLGIGYFGSSTGAAAALVAAAELGSKIQAVVSRGGRPDLAGNALSSVQCPTLLVVGGNDLTVLDLNRKALRRLRCEKQIEIIPDATHLFAEPGALQKVAKLAADWFRTHLAHVEMPRC
jgi:putative phosphoribosyl transferase